jgi:gamma-glutamylcyclotransferase (GGCT)/AIG2-like uncharacterized protein YtfP
VNECIFAYGTLLPGQPQWPLLRRYVTDLGWETKVPGRLFDTGLSYPVADFEPGRHFSTDQVVGRAFGLLDATAQIALAALDRYEEVDLGLYRRLEVTTSEGTKCWAYCLGPQALDHFMNLTRIESGDWVQYLKKIT